MDPSESEKPVTPQTSAERQFEVKEYSASGSTGRLDTVVVEEPMEIRVVFGPLDKRTMRSVSITMRTPGHDHELAAGFLMTENILDSADQIDKIETRGVDGDGNETGNIIRVELKPSVEVELGSLQRHFFTTSSCGVCGKASLEALEVQGLQPIADDGFRIDASVVKTFPDLLRGQQATFHRTGGLHGVGLADADGKLADSREDVGRHNAVDKLIGRYFLDGKTPLGKYVMIVSGRVSFEIMQKALVAGVPMIVAVGAPSSLAVEMADRYNLTLTGFASADRFNVYSGKQRIAG